VTLMTEDDGKMCEKRKGEWYCVSFLDYKLDRFANAIPRKEYERLDDEQWNKERNGNA